MCAGEVRPEAKDFGGRIPALMIGVSICPSKTLVAGVNLTVDKCWLAVRWPPADRSDLMSRPTARTLVYRTS
jgi:hypothetical protein